MLPGRSPAIWPDGATRDAILKDHAMRGLKAPAGGLSLLPALKQTGQFPAIKPFSPFRCRPSLAVDVPADAFLDQTPERLGWDRVHLDRFAVEVLRPGIARLGWTGGKVPRLNLLLRHSDPLKRHVGTGSKLPDAFLHGPGNVHARRIVIPEVVQEGPLGVSGDRFPRIM